MARVHKIIVTIGEDYTRDKVEAKRTFYIEESAFTDFTQECSNRHWDWESTQVYTYGEGAINALDRFGANVAAIAKNKY